MKKHLKTVVEDWRNYKKYFSFWKIALGYPAINHTMIHDNNSMWCLWFNVGWLGIWWRKY